MLGNEAEYKRDAENVLRNFMTKQQIEVGYLNTYSNGCNEVHWKQIGW